MTPLPDHLLEQLPAAAAEPQAKGILGYPDIQEDWFFIKAHSRDRASIPGRVASSAYGAPVRQLKPELHGQQLAVIRHSYPRPHVATHFSRSKPLNSSPKSLVYLPALYPGLCATKACR